MNVHFKNSIKGSASIFGMAAAVAGLILVVSALIVVAPQVSDVNNSQDVRSDASELCPGSAVCSPVGQEEEFCDSGDWVKQVCGSDNCWDKTVIEENASQCAGSGGGGGGSCGPDDSDVTCYKYVCPYGCGFNDSEEDDTTCNGTEEGSYRVAISCDSRATMPEDQCGQIDIIRNGENGACGVIDVNCREGCEEEVVQAYCTNATLYEITYGQNGGRIETPVAGYNEDGSISNRSISITDLDQEYLFSGLGQNAANYEIVYSMDNWQSYVVWNTDRLSDVQSVNNLIENSNYTMSQFEANGVQVYLNVFDEDGNFCDGSGNYSPSGTCEPNPCYVNINYTAPTPTPTNTPTPTPEPISCYELTPRDQSLVIPQNGSVDVDFTCYSEGPTDRAELTITSRTNGESETLQMTSSGVVNNKNTYQLTKNFTESGLYETQCTVCRGNECVTNEAEVNPTCIGGLSLSDESDAVCLTAYVGNPENPRYFDEGVQKEVTCNVNEGSQSVNFIITNETTGETERHEGYGVWNDGGNYSASEKFRFYDNNDYLVVCEACDNLNRCTSSFTCWGRLKPDELYCSDLSINTQPKLGETVTYTCEHDITDNNMFMNASYDVNFSFEMKRSENGQLITIDSQSGNSNQYSFSFEDSGSYQTECEVCHELNGVSYCSQGNPIKLPYQRD